MMTPKPPTGRAGSGSVAKPPPRRPKGNPAERALQMGRMARTHGLRVYVDLNPSGAVVIFENPETLFTSSTPATAGEVSALVAGYHGGGAA